MTKARKLVTILLSFILVMTGISGIVLAGPENPVLPAVNIRQEHMGNLAGNEIFRMVISARAPEGFTSFSAVMSYDNSIIFPVHNVTHADAAPPAGLTTLPGTSEPFELFTASTVFPITPPPVWLVLGGRTGFNFAVSSMPPIMGAGVTSPAMTDIFAFYFRVDGNDLSIMDFSTFRIEAENLPESMVAQNSAGGTRFALPGIRMISDGNEYIWGPNYPSASGTIIPDNNKTPEYVNSRSVKVAAQNGILTAGTAGTATFAVTSNGIPAGTHNVTVTGLPGAVTVQGGNALTIDAGGSGILTLAGSAAITADTHNLVLAFDNLTTMQATSVVLTTVPVTSGQFALIVGGGSAPTAVSVGPQIGAMTAGTFGTVTFPVTTSGIPDGSYIAAVANLPVGVAVQGQVIIANNSGTLTLAGSAATVAGVTPNLTLTINGVTSPAFTLTVSNPSLPQLPPPTSLTLSSTTLTWSPINNAIGYRIYAGGTQASGAIITATSFDLAALNLGVGTHSIQVRSIGDAINFTNSVLSEAINFTAQGQQIPVDNGSGQEADTPIGRPPTNQRPADTPAPIQQSAPTPIQQSSPELTPGLPQHGSSAPNIITPASQIFDDVSADAWYHDYISKAVHNNLFQGTARRTFSPEADMTRAMFVQVLANLEGIDLAAYADASPSFNDTSPESWYFAAVEWAANLEIVRGIRGGYFAPDASVTREQIAVMLYRYMHIMGIELPQGTISAFTDHASISPWAAEAVEAIQSAGIISGRPGGTFDPQATASRAEVAAVFVRFLEAGAEI